ncbi:hypothetical protein Prudu_017782, partial [Prunus dulcis]
DDKGRAQLTHPLEKLSGERGSFHPSPSTNFQTRRNLLKQGHFPSCHNKMSRLKSIVGYAKVFSTLGIACECCDGAGGDDGT